MTPNMHHHYHPQREASMVAAYSSGRQRALGGYW